MFWSRCAERASWSLRVDNTWYALIVPHQNQEIQRRSGKEAKPTSSPFSSNMLSFLALDKWSSWHQKSVCHGLFGGCDVDWMNEFCLRKDQGPVGWWTDRLDDVGVFVHRLLTLFHFCRALALPSWSDLNQVPIDDTVWHSITPSLVKPLVAMDEWWFLAQNGLVHIFSPVGKTKWCPLCHRSC
jgi:hypothetical protein